MDRSVHPSESYGILWIPYGIPMGFHRNWMNSHPQRVPPLILRADLEVWRNPAKFQPKTTLAQGGVHFLTLTLMPCTVARATVQGIRVSVKKCTPPWAKVVFGWNFAGFLQTSKSALKIKGGTLWGWEFIQFLWNPIGIP